jgi:hypothetical protein
MGVNCYDTSNDETVVKMKQYFKRNFIYICLATACLSLVSTNYTSITTRRVFDLFKLFKPRAANCSLLRTLPPKARKLIVQIIKVRD